MRGAATSRGRKPAARSVDFGFGRRRACTKIKLPFRLLATATDAAARIGLLEVYRPCAARSAADVSACAAEKSTSIEKRLSLLAPTIERSSAPSDAGLGRSVSRFS
jgi:hypothetical protein